MKNKSEGDGEVEDQFKSTESERNSSAVSGTEERNEVRWVQDHLLDLI